MFVGFFPVGENVMTQTMQWIDTRCLLREATVTAHKLFAEKYPSISNDICKYSREFLSAFDAETDAGIRLSYLLDCHIYTQKNNNAQKEEN